MPPVELKEELKQFGDFLAGGRYDNPSENLKASASS
jgi:hypothetical protein